MMAALARPPLHAVVARDEHEAEVDRLTADLRDAQERAASASADAAGLRRQVRSLTDQMAALTQRFYGHNVFTDPEQQFRHEVWLSWLHTFGPEDRDRLALRTYTLGPDFLESVATLDGVEREKIVSTCVDVICTHVWDSNGRGAHQQRENGTGGAARPVIRSDGSAAWRCAVQQQTPSARRLMWWEMVDGSVELARVAVHDDFAMR